MPIRHEWTSGQIPNVYLKLIEALLSFFENNQSNGEFFESKIGTLGSHGLNPAFARPGLVWLANIGILSQREHIDPEASETYFGWQFTADGAEFAFEYVASLSITGIEQSKPGFSWDPLPLELNSDETFKVVAAAEDLITQVRSDNDLAVSEPEMRTALINTLRSGVMYLQSSSITKQIIIQLVLSPAKWLIEHFPKAVIAASARALVDLLTGYLK